jgi:hypothetical protein
MVNIFKSGLHFFHHTFKKIPLVTLDLNSNYFKANK